MKVWNLDESLKPILREFARMQNSTLRHTRLFYSWQISNTLPSDRFSFCGYCADSKITRDYKFFKVEHRRLFFSRLSFKLNPVNDMVEQRPWNNICYSSFKVAQHTLTFYINPIKILIFCKNISRKPRWLTKQLLKCIRSEDERAVLACISRRLNSLPTTARF